MIENVLDKISVQFWSARKYVGRVKSYELGPELCAQFEYGFRNVVSVFVQESWGTFSKAWKIIFTGDIELSCSFYPSEATSILSRAPFNVKRFFKNEYLGKTKIEVPCRKTKKPQTVHFVGLLLISELI